MRNLDFVRTCCTARLSDNHDTVATTRSLCTWLKNDGAASSCAFSSPSVKCQGITGTRATNNRDS